MRVPTSSGDPVQRGGLRVRLYFAGDAPNSIAALLALRAVLAELDPGAEVELIDVLREPQRGIQDGILVTPMLVRTAPLPERRLLGNLSNRALLLGVLGLHEVAVG